MHLFISWEHIFIVIKWWYQSYQWMHQTWYKRLPLAILALESFGHVTQSRTNFSLKSWNDHDVLYCLLSNAFSLLYFPFSYQNKYCVVYLWWKAKCVQSLHVHYLPTFLWIYAYVWCCIEIIFCNPWLEYFLFIISGR